MIYLIYIPCLNIHVDTILNSVGDLFMSFIDVNKVRISFIFTIFIKISTLTPTPTPGLNNSHTCIVC